MDHLPVAGRRHGPERRFGGRRHLGRHRVGAARRLPHRVFLFGTGEDLSGSRLCQLRLLRREGFPGQPRRQGERSEVGGPLRQARHRLGRPPVLLGLSRRHGGDDGDPDRLHLHPVHRRHAVQHGPDGDRRGVRGRDRVYRLSRRDRVRQHRPVDQRDPACHAGRLQRPGDPVPRHQSGARDAMGLQRRLGRGASAQPPGRADSIHPGHPDPGRLRELHGPVRRDEGAQDHHPEGDYHLPGHPGAVRLPARVLRRRPDGQ